MYKILIKNYDADTGLYVEEYLETMFKDYDSAEQVAKKHYQENEYEIQPMVEGE